MSEARTPTRSWLINLPNLTANVLPTRKRARLVIRINGSRDRWDADALRDVVRDYVVEHLASGR